MATLKYLLTLSIFCFLIGAIMGYAFSGNDIHKSENTQAHLKTYDPDSLKYIPNLTFNYFLINNLKAILFASFGGALTFGGLTLWNLVINGIPLGISFHSSWTLKHLGELKAFFLLIFPHGIFEIPALIIAGAAGFKIPYELLRHALGKKEEIITEEDAKEFFKLVAISVVLIFIASLIEAKITVKIAENLV